MKKIATSLVVFLLGFTAANAREVEPTIEINIDVLQAIKASEAAAGKQVKQKRPATLPKKHKKKKPKKTAAPKMTPMPVVPETPSLESAPAPLSTPVTEEPKVETPPVETTSSFSEKTAAWKQKIKDWVAEKTAPAEPAPTPPEPPAAPITEIPAATPVEAPKEEPVKQPEPQPTPVIEVPKVVAPEAVVETPAPTEAPKVEIPTTEAPAPTEAKPEEAPVAAAPEAEAPKSELQQKIRDKMDEWLLKFDAWKENTKQWIEEKTKSEEPAPVTPEPAATPAADAPLTGAELRSDELAKKPEEEPSKETPAPAAPVVAPQPETKNVMPDAPSAPSKKLEHSPSALYTVLFAAGDDTIAQADMEPLKALAAKLHQNPQMRVTVLGYASLADGTQESDARKLSLRRAVAVRKFLISNGIESTRINVQALGSETSETIKDRVAIQKLD